MVRLRLGLWSLCCWLVCSAASAHVERFAVIVGNDRGLPSDLELRYAESDARKVADVFQELGGLEPANTVLLAGRDADTLRRTLITVNDRIRNALSEPNTEAMLFVYYSGHADADALHLGSTLLRTHELAQLVRGSAATVRLLVVDACRSGELTRAKGGKIRPPFPLDEEYQLSSQGLAFLTASSAHEDAQESDALKGSFFTHALISGLLGAADQNADGRIELEEAYRYAYDATLRSTSRTAHGTQHPTFHYDLKGQGRLVLTQTRLTRTQRGTLNVAAGLDVLVFRHDANGPVIAEIFPGEQARSLTLAPGNYFARVRASSHLLEGTLTVAAGRTTELNTDALRRIEYAQLVRKGAGAQSAVHSLELGGRARSALPNAETPCWGVLLGYRADLERVGISTRVGYCESRFHNAAIAARVHELDLGLRIGRAWDVGALTLELGAGGAAVLFLQVFNPERDAALRRSLVGNASAFAAASFELGRGTYLGLDVEGQVYVLRLLEDHQGSLRAAFAGRSALLLGKHF